MKRARSKNQNVQVKMRPALATDKEPIVDFCKHIWHGHDYLPKVWDEWFNDTKGRLLVATVDGKAVGVAHAYLQAPKDAWLEGVRVNPNYRGYGIAGKLNRGLLEWARKKGARVARLCTGNDNKASRNHLLKTGFKPVQTFARYVTTRPLKKKPLGTRRPRKYRSTIWKNLEKSTGYNLYSGLYADGWTWYPLTPPTLRALVTDGRVFLHDSDGIVSGFAVGVPDERGLTLGLATGPPAHIEANARYMRYLLSKSKRPKKRIRALIPDSLATPLRKAGFRKTGATIVYEKKTGH